MDWSIQLNSKNYTKNNIEEIDDAEIVPFLTEWGNEKDTVTVQTSGSTGIPKPIKLLKLDMISSAQLTGEYFDLQIGNSALLCLPTKYIAGKMMLVRAMVLKLNLITVAPSSNPMLNIIEKIDFAAMTPMQVKIVLKESSEKLNLIKKLIIGGAAVGTILERDLQRLKTACFSTYGMTETITHIAVKKLNKMDKSDLFHALPNVTFSVNKDDCLIINTPHLTTLTVTTNDIVEITNLECFKWVGRCDNIINSGGVKTQPEAIESKILNVLKSNRFFISSLPDKLLDERIILIVESHSEIEGLQGFINAILAPFERPKNIYFTPRFAETETGKINRQKTIKHIINLSSIDNS